MLSTPLQHTQTEPLMQAADCFVVYCTTAIPSIILHVCGYLSCWQSAGSLKYPILQIVHGEKVLRNVGI